MRFFPCNILSFPPLLLYNTQTMMKKSSCGKTHHYHWKFKHKHTAEEKRRKFHKCWRGCYDEFFFPISGKIMNNDSIIYTAKNSTNKEEEIFGSLRSHFQFDLFSTLCKGTHTHTSTHPLQFSFIRNKKAFFISFFLF